MIKYGDFPTLEEIRSDYNELVAMVGNPFTVAAVELLQVAHPSLFLEVNGDPADEYIARGGTDSGIDWVRVDSFGCLDYIYFFRNGRVWFDVWSNWLYDDFIIDTTAERLTAEVYAQAVEEAWGR